MKNSPVRNLTAWVLIALIASLTPNQTSALTFRELTNLYIQGGIIAPDKAVFAREIADQADRERVGALLNVSTSIEIKDGGALTIGFVIGPGMAGKYLVRCVGPGLGAFGVPNTLPNPKLTIHNNGREIWSNEDWKVQNSTPGVQRITQADITQAQLSVGAFPTIHDNDAATIISLESGPFSVVTGEQFNRGGYALLEVYKMP